MFCSFPFLSSVMILDLAMSLSIYIHTLYTQLIEDRMIHLSYILLELKNHVYDILYTQTEFYYHHQDR